MDWKIYVLKKIKVLPTITERQQIESDIEKISIKKCPNLGHW